MLSAAMFIVSLAWNLVFVGLPFHIHAISTGDAAATLRWTGWIVGITSLVTMTTTPFWGRLAARGNPKAACALVQVFQSAGFVATALANSLTELFLARFALGVVGSTSTFAFILAGRAQDPGAVRRLVAAVQSAIMAGGVVGPLAGAAAAVRLGFRLTFGLGAALLAASAALIHWGVAPPAAPLERTGAGRRLPVRDLAMVAIVVLVGSTQEAFLAAVLPQVLPGLGVAPADTLELGGALIFASGAAAALGGLAAPRLADLWAERRLLGAALAASSIGLAALGAVHSVWLYLLVRAAQSACIAPLFPLLVARVARHGSADAIGVVNAARIAGGFVGPVVATTVLAWGSPEALYLVLGAAGLATVPLIRDRRAGTRSAPAS